MQSSHDLEKRCVHELFEAQALLHPHNIAVICCDQRITYRELNTSSSQLLCAFRSHFSCRTISLHHTRYKYEIDYNRKKLRETEKPLPLQTLQQQDHQDPQQSSVPQQPQQAISTIELVSPETFSSFLKTLTVPIVNLKQNFGRVSPDNLGKPKGVQIEHKSVVNFLLSMAEEPGFTENDVMFALTTICFDISVLELFLPLVTGGSVHIVEKAVAVDGLALRKQLEGSGATIMQGTPSSWRLLIESGWLGNPNLKILVGGEPLLPSLGNWLVPRVKELWNMYGPTEATVWCTLQKVAGLLESLPPIGSPICNTFCYILDSETHEQLPAMQRGELWVGGACVGRGYKGKSELTNQKFLKDPFTGGRMYNTGDIAMYNTQGVLFCFGRADTQVKVNGFRIELGEIEAILSCHPQLKNVNVGSILEGDRKQIIAYIVPITPKSCPSDVDLQGFLNTKLPHYMIPSMFARLDSIPLLPNGKTDRNALLTIVPSSAVPKTIKQLTSQETEILEICSYLLPSQAPLDLKTNLPAVGGTNIFIKLSHESEKEIEEDTHEFQMLTPINKEGNGVPMYIVHPAGGFIFMYYSLVEQLPNTPIYGFQDPSLGKVGEKPFKTVYAAAAVYAEMLLKHRPNGPYRIAGWSMGGKIAFEMASILTQKQKEVTLIIIDSWFYEDYQWLRFWASNLKKAFPFIRDKFKLRFGASSETHQQPKLRRQHLYFNVPQLLKTLHCHMKAVADYKPQPYSGPVFLIRAEETARKFKYGQDPVTPWMSVCPNIVVGDVPGDHFSMMNTSNVKFVGMQIAEVFARGMLIPKLTPNSRVQAM